MFAARVNRSNFQINYDHFKYASIYSDRQQSACASHCIASVYFINSIFRCEFVFIAFYESHSSFWHI